MSVIHVEDPRIEVLRIRVNRASLAFRWLGAAGVILEDIAYLIRKYDRVIEERDTLRSVLASMANGLPAAPEKGEHIEYLSNQTGDDERDDRA